MVDNKNLTISIVLLTILQISILFSGLGEYFIVPNIEFKYILLTGIICIIVFILEEISKPIYVKLFRDSFGGSKNER